jgi:hypothetical protein
LFTLPCFHPKIDGKGKGGHVENNKFQSKGKSQIKLQVKLMIQAKVVAWPLHKINLLDGKMNYQHGNP